jgi:outer membrane lipoprotein-sorting protein
MRKLHRLQPVAVALLLALLLGSCGGTPRKLSFGHRHKPATGTAPRLKVATRDELNAILTSTYDAIHSFEATRVSLTASSGSVYQGHVLDYTAIHGVILFRKPDDIRVQATLPFVGTLAFDMVSNGSDFRFSSPRSTPPLFVEGRNSAPATSANKMENLRPEAFLSSMLIRPWDPATESVMLKDETDEEDALYRLEFNGKARDGSPIPGREIWFDRLDLSIVRQKVYEKDGNIASDTSYSEWRQYNGISFPAHIDINRPIDGYGVAIEVLQMEMNKEIADGRFVLEQPEGSKLQEIK